jgi:hypothetical protein
METDGGGWTLFLNYKHTDGATFKTAALLPADLNTNANLYLNEAGFEERDIRELRFFCTEYNIADKKLWHFKTTHPGVIKTALTGDQVYMTGNVKMSEGYKELPKPANMLDHEAFKGLITNFTVGGEKGGGFTNSPFKSPSGSWTIKGNNPNYEKYECGTVHEIDPNGIMNQINASAKVNTHHSVYFRGSPLSEHEARDRNTLNILNN